MPWRCFSRIHKVFFGLTRQCWQTYHPEADSDPPRTLIESTAGTKQNIPEDEAITLSFRGGG